MPCPRPSRRPMGRYVCSMYGGVWYMCMCVGGGGEVCPQFLLSFVLAHTQTQTEIINRIPIPNPLYCNRTGIPDRAAAGDGLDGAVHSVGPQERLPRHRPRRHGAAVRLLWVQACVCMSGATQRLPHHIPQATDDTPDAPPNPNLPHTTHKSQPPAAVYPGDGRPLRADAPALRPRVARGRPRLRGLQTPFAQARVAARGGAGRPGACVGCFGVVLLGWVYVGVGVGVDVKASDD